MSLRKLLSVIIFIINLAAFVIPINSFYTCYGNLVYLPLMIVLFTLGSLMAYYPRKKPLPKRFMICSYGNRLLRLFLMSACISIMYQSVMAFAVAPGTWKLRLASIVTAIVLEAVVFWLGIIMVYSTSTQLGIKTRVLGAVFGMVPIVNVIMLGKIITTTTDEIVFEWEKCILNEKRKDEKICATKYPLLMVHGVFFRDYKRVSYWGRITGELIKNGATIYYGEHQSALSVEDSGKELALRIKKIVKDTGCEKVNIIAHSKGGLDSRMAIYAHDLEPYVASLTTINSPHRGCKFADYLLNIMPQKIKDNVAITYNAALKKLGDTNPDFLAAVRDLTSERGVYLDSMMKKPEAVFCQSVGSRLKKATSGKFPLNFSYLLVKYFDGYNDGLVGEDSFEWGDKYIVLDNQYDRGISHGDVIDLNRENIPGFDVREWYVSLVSDLRERGY